MRTYFFLFIVIASSSALANGSTQKESPALTQGSAAMDTIGRTAPFPPIASSEEPKNTSGSEEWLDGPESWTAIFTFSLAAITGLLWRATYKLYQATVDLSREAKKEGERQATETKDSIAQATRAATAMENMAKEAKISSEAAISAAKAAETTAAIMADSTVHELRAYLCINVDGIEAKSTAAGANTIKVSILIANYGKTPAHNVIAKTISFPAPHPIGQNEISQDCSYGTPTPIGLLAPSDVWNLIVTINLSNILSSPNTDRMRQTRCHITGEISYTDVFGKTRFTKFLINHTGSSKFESCSYGNLMI